MLEQQEREFPSSADGGAPVAFQVAALPYQKGFRLLAELAKMFGPALGILVDGAGGIEAKASLAALVGQKSQGAMFERVAQALVMNLDADKALGMIAQLRDVSQVKQTGKWIELSKVHELVFRGQTLLLLRWLAFALEVQFGDFLSLSRNLAPPESSGGASPPQA